MQETGASSLAGVLLSQGVTTVFCVTGAGNLAIVDALASRKEFSLRFFHGEQAAAMAAIGFTRVSGELPLVLVTTGGGTSNVVTGVLSAYLDSVPMLVISGNESTYHIEHMSHLRAVGVQGFDSCKLLNPISKRTLRISSSSEIVGAVLSSIKIAKSGRHGPVHIDFPMDIQRKKTESSPEVTFDSNIEKELPKLRDEDKTSLLESIARSRKPLLIVGKGLKEPELLLRFCEREKIPFSPSWSSFDRYPDSHPLNVGKIGIYGERAANFILQHADLVICLGTRLSIPQVGYDRHDFGRHAQKVVVDIDPNELSKFPVEKYLTLNCDAKEFIEFLHEDSISELPQISNREIWLSKIKQTRLLLPKIEIEREGILLEPTYVHSIELVSRLNKLMDDDAIIVTDVGAGLLSGHYALESNGKRHVMTSQGLGEMGFGLPGAIGASIGAPKKQVICLNTDGGIMFNLQELETVRTHAIPLKLFIFNNEGYAMIKISQGNLFDKKFVGSTTGSDLSFPDFSKIAVAFGFEYIRVDSATTDQQLLNGLDSPIPYLFEVIMSPEQKYFPRLGTRKLEDGSLVSPGIEDLDPPLGEEVMSLVEQNFQEKN